MNKIVREHYPAAKLPDDLRGELGLDAEVTVTVEQREVQRDLVRDAAREAAIVELLAHRGELAPARSDAAARVRGLRDEWDL